MLYKFPVIYLVQWRNPKSGHHIFLMSWSTSCNNRAKDELILNTTYKTCHGQRSLRTIAPANAMQKLKWGKLHLFQCWIQFRSPCIPFAQAQGNVPHEQVESLRKRRGLELGNTEVFIWSQARSSATTSVTKRPQKPLSCSFGLKPVHLQPLVWPEDHRSLYHVHLVSSPFICNH